MNEQETQGCNYKADLRARILDGTADDILKQIEGEDEAAHAFFFRAGEQPRADYHRGRISGIRQAREIARMVALRDKIGRHNKTILATCESCSSKMPNNSCVFFGRNRRDVCLCRHYFRSGDSKPEGPQEPMVHP